MAVEDSPLVSEARLEATRLAYSELRSVSNLGRWKEGGEKGVVEMSRWSVKREWSRAKSTVGALEMDTSRIRCASGKDTRMWSMADHDSVSPDVVDRV